MLRDLPPDLKAAFGDGFNLQKPKETRLHQLMDDTNDPVLRPYLDQKLQVFLINHDWWSLFKNSDVADDVKLVRPPYEHCCFEFLVSGKPVCVIASYQEAIEKWQRVVFIKSTEGWLALGLELPDLCALLYNQISAALVVLDAAVAVTEIVRAPERLNRARVNRGALPLFDYHVVKLNNRSRPATLPDESSGDRRGVRLHFRRGHWRRYDSYKTWINWMLVGDPDLGFIDKHYSM